MFEFPWGKSYSTKWSIQVSLLACPIKKETVEEALHSKMLAQTGEWGPIVLGLGW